MKKVLHVVSKMDRAGAESMIMNLYRAVNKSAVQFDFIVFTKEAGGFDSEIVSLGGRLHRIIAPNPIKRMFALKEFLLAHPEYKILHCHMLLSNAFHVLAAKWANVPVRISHSHSTQNKSKGKIIDFLYQTFSRIVIRNASTHFIGCGKAAANFLFPGQQNVFMLPNSVDTGLMANIGNTKNEYWFNEFNIGRQFLKIIQVGRLEPVKNFSFSIQLAKYMKEQGFSFRMMLVGQGKLFDNLAQEIESFGLKEYVYLLGSRDDVPYLMAGADVMLMPSLHEGFPVVLVESQAVGLPALIASTISKEVDLKMGMIQFLGLDEELSKWAESLRELSVVKIMSDSNRLKVLKDKGFDILSNAKTMTSLYEHPELYGKLSPQ
ncbi:glycosyltransferase [Marinilabilia sp.]|uniref:glycosyltransferase n=1 Tax=Marinilabilia sp. TaxID=2021252 RepID=UPI0025BBD77B|nr:glycosyltransferase [Marinilabilia sp.]